MPLKPSTTSFLLNSGLHLTVQPYHRSLGPVLRLIWGTAQVSAIPTKKLRKNLYKNTIKLVSRFSFPLLVMWSSQPLLARVLELLQQISQTLSPRITLTVPISGIMIFWLWIQELQKPGSLIYSRSSETGFQIILLWQLSNHLSVTPRIKNIIVWMELSVAWSIITSLNMMKVQLHMIAFLWRLEIPTQVQWWSWLILDFSPGRS